MSRAGAAAAVLAALVLAGCGSEDESEPASPAALAPAGVSVYAEGVVRPAGEQREALESSLSLLLDSEDPGARIVEELNRVIVEEDSEVSYQGDIEPWLGERAAVFFTELIPGEDSAPAFGDDGERGAIAVQATDADAARAFVDKAAAEEGETEEGSHEGVDYTLIDERLAIGLVGDHLVLADERTFGEVVDTEVGGPALADDESFGEILGGTGEWAAGLYLDLPEIVAAAGASGELGRADREALDTALAGIADQPAAATLDAQADGFALEVSYGSTELPFAGAAQESILLRELPEEAWLAVGLNDLGGAIGSFLRRAEDFGLAGRELARAERGFVRDYGVRLEEFYAPLGDAAVFASGRGVFGIGGGLVVETESREAAAEVLAALRRQTVRSGENVRPLPGGRATGGFSVVLPDAPSALNFVAARERIVIAYGDEAAAAGLEPAQTLSANDEFAAAVEALGGGFAVGAFLDFGPLSEMLDLAAAADPSIREALPYLDAIDFLIAGSSSEAGRDRQRLFLGLEEDVSGPAT